ncbi:MAG TPA: GFA family protein [Albitalea sp.]|jgi:hypothetical protein|nr:GFA family protein [Albitalea sp.]
MNTPDFADGGCLCGAVRYRIQGAPRSSGVCHCRSCRLASGAPAVGWIAVGLDRYQLLQGHPATRHSSPHVVRSFCPRCGTPFGYRNDDAPELIELTTATLDHPEQFPPTREIWLEHRIAWEAVNPALAHHPHDSGDAAI